MKKIEIDFVLFKIIDKLVEEEFADRDGVIDIDRLTIQFAVIFHIVFLKKQHKNFNFFFKKILFQFKKKVARGVNDLESNIFKLIHINKSIQTYINCIFDSNSIYFYFSC